MIVKEKAKALLAKITGNLGALRAFGSQTFAADLKKTCATLAGKAGPLPSRLLQSLASIPLMAGKKRVLFFAAGGLAALLLVLVITAAALNSRRPGEAAAMQAAHFIPSEELFIPDEPDFVPDFLLEREPRHLWSIDDIRPYWRTSGNPEFWHNIIRSAVDELMENIP